MHAGRPSLVLSIVAISITTLLTACSSDRSLGLTEYVPEVAAEKVDVVPPAVAPDMPVAARFYGEIDPLGGTVKLYPLHAGDTIYRDQLITALRYEYGGAGGGVACTEAGVCTIALSLFTDQNKVTYIRNEPGFVGQCVSNGYPCGTTSGPGAGNAPAPTTAPCNVAGTWCGPLALSSGLSYPLQNVIVQIGQVSSCLVPGTNNCIRGCQDTAAHPNGAFGLCARTDNTKVDAPATSSLTSLIASTMGASANGCSYCYGNRAEANAAGLSGLRHVLRPSANHAIYTTTVAIPLRNEKAFPVSFDIRFTGPGFDAPGTMVMRNSASAIRQCVVEASGSVTVTGGGFGPPAECLAGGFPPASCPLSSTAPDTTRYSMRFQTTDGGFITPAAGDYIQWSDASARVRVPASGAATYTGAVIIHTPTGDKVSTDLFAVCTGGASCQNNSKNGNESDVDCGGTSSCVRCGVGKVCTAGTDCLSGVCTGGFCAANTCSDGVKNGTETDIDCGGSCGACAFNKICLIGADCQSGFCPNVGNATKRCGQVGCGDGIREGFVNDAQFPNIAGCSGGWAKTPPGASAPNTGLLAPRSCNSVGGGDDSTNPTGTNCAAVDLCQPGWGICASSAAVVANLPSGGSCASATAGTMGNLFFASQQSSAGNGLCGPTGTNDMWGCGNYGGAIPGGGFSPCGAFNRFSHDLCSQLTGTESGWSCGTDGFAELTNAAKTTATGGGVLCCRGCGDGVKNGAETDIDCGGGACVDCAAGLACLVDSDCQSNLCVGGVCAAASTCTDGIQNQTETAIDCGGSSGCATCSNNNTCVTGTDCASTICGTNFLCGRQLAGACTADSQCQSGKCTGSVCVAATCSDGVKNGTETDVDCGGSCAADCALTKVCSLDADCQSGHCAFGKCGTDGCADGVREGFTNTTTYPNVAACSGGWSVAGMATAASCGRLGGDDGSNPGGVGCAAADLCRTGWHVCSSATDFQTKSGQANCNNSTPTAGLFFATQQSSTSATTCSATGNNDIWGCGDDGAANTCGALGRSSADLCTSLLTGGAGWACGVNGTNEKAAVTKSGSVGGGVICCRD